MMILIKAAVIVDPNSKYHLQTKDIKIENGSITAIGEQLEAAADTTVIAQEGLHVSPGWFDCGVNIEEPGQEEVETVASGLKAAAKGGFTAVAQYSPKKRPADDKSSIEFLLQKAEGNLVNLYPIGAATKNLEGKEMVEAYDMSLSGAIAFSDNKKVIKNDLLQQLILQYNSNLGAITISKPLNEVVMHGGQMHEGEVSTRIGLKGIPTLAESMQLSRDLYLAEYSDGKLHVPNISATESIRLMAEAQAKGLDVSCHATPHHLLLRDELLTTFETRYKVNPPLRDEENVESIKQGIADGVISMLSSDHTPIDIEKKMIEFPHAGWGTTGLQTAFGASWKALEGRVDLTKMVELWCHNPRSRFGIPTGIVEENAMADLTLFNPNTEWTASGKDLVSMSKNTAFEGQSLKGAVVGVINNMQLELN